MHGFSTRAIHAGQEPDPTTGAVIVPIHATSTFVQDGVGGTRGGYEYSRSANPTRTALQECLAALEGGRQALAFGSGMGASDVLLRTLLRPGDHVVLPHDAYGGTYRLVDKVLVPWGIEYTPVDLADVAALRAAIRPQTRVVWCETPTNPLLGIADIIAVAEIVHGGGARLVVDNTFASPYLQQPLALGADVVLHSTTKYVGGHSDVVGGALVTGDAELAFHAERLLALIMPPNATRSTADRVRRSLRLLLPEHRGTLGDVARELCLTPRSLQRQLRREDESFGALLDEVRRELALQYLSASHSVTEIALIVGYHSACSFTRWFKTQFGLAPVDWRNAAGAKADAGPVAAAG